MKLKNVLAVTTLLFLAILTASCQKNNYGKNNALPQISQTDYEIQQHYEFIGGKDSYTISGIRNLSGNVLIPSAYLGLPIKAIQFAWYSDTFQPTGCSNLSLVIPEGITYVSIYNVDALVALSVPGTATNYSIGNCKNLKDLYLGDGITTTYYPSGGGQGVGSGLFSLENIRLPSTIEYCSLRTEDSSAGTGTYYPSLKYNDYDGALYLGNETNPYLVCCNVASHDIKKLVVHNDCRVFSSHLFTWKYGVEEIVFNNNLVYVKCSFPNVKRISLPIMKTFDEYSFAECRKVEKLVVPEGCEHIETQAFYAFSSLNTLILPRSLKKLDKGAFLGSSIRFLTVNCDITSDINLPSCRYQLIIGEDVKNVELPTTYIMDYDYFEILNKTGITFEFYKGGAPFLNVSKTEEEAKIQRNTGFVWYREEDGDILIDYLGHDLFVVIPNNIKRIKTNIFCDEMISLTIPESVIEVPRQFAQRPVSTSYGTLGHNGRLLEIVNMSSCEIYSTYANTGRWLYVVDSDSKSKIKQLSNGLITVDLDGYTSVVGYAGNEENVIIPDGVEYIRCHSFLGASFIKKIICPLSLKEIGPDSFNSCSRLEQIAISDSVSKLGADSFYGCYSLSCVDYSGTVDEWNSIEKAEHWANTSSISTVRCVDGDVVI